jgi:hypothetical protein
VQAKAQQVSKAEPTEWHSAEANNQEQKNNSTSSLSWKTNYQASTKALATSSQEKPGPKPKPDMVQSQPAQSNITTKNPPDSVENSATNQENSLKPTQPRNEKNRKARDQVSTEECKSLPPLPTKLVEIKTSTMTTLEPQADQTASPKVQTIVNQKPKRRRNYGAYQNRHQPQVLYWFQQVETQLYPPGYHFLDGHNQWVCPQFENGQYKFYRWECRNQVYGWYCN